MQTLIIAGTVTKVAALRRTNSGDAVLGFTVVVDNGKDRDGNRRDGTFFDCSLWGKRAESLESHITKGKKLTVSGRPTARAYEGKAYLGLSVNELTFMGEANQNTEARSQQQDSYSGSAMDDEIPF